MSYLGYTGANRTEALSQRSGGGYGDTSGLVAGSLPRGDEGDASGVRFPRVTEENGAKGDSCWSCSGSKPVRVSPPLLSPLQLRSASLPCATRPNDNSRRGTREKPGPPSAIPVRKTMVPTRAPFCKLCVPRLQACFYITASSAFFSFFFSFFYVDASCSENMEFLKGATDAAVHMSAIGGGSSSSGGVQQSPLRMTDGSHLVKVS